MPAKQNDECARIRFFWLLRRRQHRDSVLHILFVYEWVLVARACVSLCVYACECKILLSFVCLIHFRLCRILFFVHTISQKRTRKHTSRNILWFWPKFFSKILVLTTRLKTTTIKMMADSGGGAIPLFNSLLLEVFLSFSICASIDYHFHFFSSW